MYKVLIYERFINDKKKLIINIRAHLKVKFKTLYICMNYIV